MRPSGDLTTRLFSSVAELPDGYRALFGSAERVALDQGLSWYRNLVATVYPDDGVCFVATERDGHPVAVLPMRLGATVAGRPREAASLSNYYTWLYAPAASEPEPATAFSAMIRSFGERYASLSVIRLSPMDPDANVFAALERGLRQAGWRPFRYFCFGNWYLDVRNTDWATYLNSRSSELRNTIRRKGNRFAADGGTLAVVTGGDALDEALSAYRAIYAASWKREEPYPAFIPGLVRTAAAEGWLRLGIARLKGEPVAAQIWLVGHGTANIYKLAYDEKFAAYSAGTLLTAHLMRHVIEVDRVEIVDFLSGDDTYKPTWMSGRRERWGIVGYNPRTIAGLSGLFHELAGRIAKLLLTRIKRRQT